MLKFNLSILFIFCVSYLFSQTAKDSGKVELIQDTRINEMLNKRLLVSEGKDGKIAGYRVQIHFGSDADVAKNVKSKFMQKNDTIAAYSKYDQPNFKIRVGDFRTRLDAYRFYKLIMGDFPGAFIVQDEIEIKELVK